MKIASVERVGRVGAVVVGGTLLALTYVGPARWWHALGAVPLAMGMSGW
jgi:hypothetical protein